MNGESEASKILNYGNTEALYLNNYELIYNNDTSNISHNLKFRSNKPLNTKQEIVAVLKTRDKSLCLVPEFIQVVQENDKTDEKPKLNRRLIIK
ncbi:hypothetical protein HUE58_04890 [Candidatus Ruthia endofausta]|uniref:Uncharacterized protein n=1 Tax=Candidatus Ruthia endofausta TaxID=2738852 RepID=A0A6N0HQ66_9GAMM|nr:hypothetical protein [Candidatus Ruthia endofausta]QKQ24455.1 hypothetical protein HUE58_04890 [Candidatus Ruthia endofausta]